MIMVPWLWPTPSCLHTFPSYYTPYMLFLFISCNSFSIHSRISIPIQFRAWRADRQHFEGGEGGGGQGLGKGRMEGAFDSRTHSTFVCDGLVFCLVVVVVILFPIPTPHSQVVGDDTPFPTPSNILGGPFPRPFPGTLWVVVWCIPRHLFPLLLVFDIYSLCLLGEHYSNTFPGGRCDLPPQLGETQLLTVYLYSPFIPMAFLTTSFPNHLTFTYHYYLLFDIVFIYLFVCIGGWTLVLEGTGIRTGGQGRLGRRRDSCYWFAGVTGRGCPC